MISVSNEPQLHLVAEDSMWFHMDDYVRKTILPKINDFESNLPRIVQDNAHTSRKQISNGMKTKQAKGKNFPKSFRERNFSRWESSIDTPADQDLPCVDSDPAYNPFKERWSNGITDTSKDSKQVDTRFGTNGVIGNDLATSLASDLKSRIYLGAGNRVHRSLPLNSALNPQHSLIRPERIPSNECFLNAQAHHPLRSVTRIKRKSKLPSNGGGNYRWERSSKSVQQKC